MNADATIEVATPRHAATVLLLREGQSDFEALLIRRHARLSFMGGQWVFPGGVWHPADDAIALQASMSRGPTQNARLTDLRGQVLSPQMCLSLAVTACRETFEETGVLLASHVDGQSCSMDLLLRLQESRAAIASQPQLLAPLLEHHGLRLDLGRLVYWAHWITPSSAPRRFDTRFFATEVSSSQAATADAVETVEHAWMTPAALIACARRGEMPISHPTLFNLEDLRDSQRRHSSLRTLLSEEAQRAIVPILPKMIREGDHTTMIMPWDPDYPNTPGEGAPDHLAYPAPLVRQPSRVVLV